MYWVAKKLKKLAIRAIRIAFFQFRPRKNQYMSISKMAEPAATTNRFISGFFCQSMVLTIQVTRLARSATSTAAGRFFFLKKYATTGSSIKRISRRVNVIFAAIG